jgi:hypothetical protein
MEVADYFKLSKNRARTIIRQIGKAVAGWRKEATKLGIEKSEQEVMASAFEHDDLRANASRPPFSTAHPLFRF